MSAPRRSLFFRAVLPVLYAVGCWFGFEYPGDEYGLWLMGSMAGIWMVPVHGYAIAPFVGDDISNYRVPILLGGMLTLYLVGRFMDRRGASPKEWGLCYFASLVIFAAITFGTGPLELSRVADELWCGFGFALYCSILLVAVMAYRRRISAQLKLPK